jgi:hypothetical protein
MPRPLTDRQKWEQERAEVSAQIARWQAEIVRLGPGDRTRSEMLEWMVRRDMLRMETLRKWIAADEGHPPA